MLPLLLVLLLLLLSPSLLLVVVIFLNLMFVFIILVTYLNLCYLSYQIYLVEFYVKIMLAVHGDKPQIPVA